MCHDFVCFIHVDRVVLMSLSGALDVCSYHLSVHLGTIRTMCKPQLGSPLKLTECS